MSDPDDFYEKEARRHDNFKKDLAEDAQRSERATRAEAEAALAGSGDTGGSGATSGSPRTADEAQKEFTRIKDRVLDHRLPECTALGDQKSEIWHEIARIRVDTTGASDKLEAVRQRIERHSGYSLDTWEGTTLNAAKLDIIEMAFQAKRYASLSRS